MTDVYYNGRIYTGEEGFASAFAVENGRFTAVGSDASVLPLAGETGKRVDLKGRFVCAGFIDSHMHLLNFGQVLKAAKLYEHTESLEAVVSCMKEHLTANPPAPGEWLTGRGWNQDYFKDERRMPDRWDLDAVSMEIPIMITRTCGHCCVLNSKALELAGIDGSTPSPDGGSIGMKDGVPDGRLYDNAMDLALGSMPVPDKDGLKRMIRLACAELNKYGITSVHSDDYCVFRSVPFETVNEAYRELAESGELTVRVYEQCNFTELSELRRFVEAGNVTGTGDAMFRIGPLKLLGDGALGSRTAHLSRPYNGDPENVGFSLFSKEKLNGLVSYANSNGMQIAVHAIGDACLDSVLDAYEKALSEHPRKDHRHGIVHCQITRRDQLERMLRLGLHIYAQSIFLDYDNHIVEKLVAPELAETSYCWKTLLRGGAVVSNGSDCPVELPDVMKGVECAVIRRSMDGTGPFHPEEAFTVAEALESFTANGACASFEEKEKGRIRAGMLADFTVLSGDPFDARPEKLHSIYAVGTYLGGKAVFVRAGNRFMRLAIDEAMKGISAGHGGPFGTVIVKDGEVVAQAHNRVLADHDATCHGEIAAIRAAGKRLGTHDLKGCVLYTTGEPCPMCLCACLWANIERVYYGCTIADNEMIGFRDEDFDEKFGGRDAFSDYLVCMDREACLDLFEKYLEMDKRNY